jgi:predicted esterase
MRSRPLLLVTTTTLLLGLGCPGEDPGKGPGEACLGTYECMDPYVCAHDATCALPGQYPGTRGRGQECVSTADCQLDFICGGGSVCTDPGTGGLGAYCSGSEYCLRGLVCAGDGACRSPGDAGTATDGEACTSGNDCEWGLFCGETDQLCHRLSGEGGPCASHDQCVAYYFCGPEDTCTPRLAPGAICDETAQCEVGLVCDVYGGICQSLPLYQGEVCPDPDLETGPFRVFFEVPRAGSAAGDFYRLPFPNDVRLKDGRVVLAGHPDPGTLVPGGVVGRYLQAIEREVSGFGLNSSLLLRFSGDVEYATLSLSGEAPSIRLVVIDPTSSRYGQTHAALGYRAQSNRSKYICERWLGVNPLPGYPLDPGTTYALILTTAITDESGVAAVPDDDLAALLAAAPPAGDDDLAAAWDAYAPLRAFLADETVPTTVRPAAGEVAVAAVFTTQRPAEVVPALRQVLRTETAEPTPASLVRCAEAVVSPCDDGLAGDEHARGCFGEDAAFHEIQGTYETPLFQAGDLPYRTAGGGFVLTADGTPIPQGVQDVCFSATVPRDATMPDEGWPVVIFLHGTGGSYRNHVTSGVAGTLAAIDVGGETVRAVVLGIDQVMHGARRGGDDTHPNFLFFNFANPQAARYNVLQGVADVLQLVRLVESFAVTVEGVGEVRLDPSRIYLFGHSQGVITGAPAVAYEPAIRAAVYSGGGGLLIESLLTKTSPFDVAGAVQYAMADGDVGFVHPVLNLFQLYLEPSDTINYMAAQYLSPPAGVPAHHVLFGYGLGDTYSTNRTAIALFRAAGAHLVRPVLDPIDWLGDLAAPVRANRGPITEGAVQLAPDGDYDGHFVLLRHPDGIANYAQFFGTALADPDGIPTIIGAGQ